MRLDKVFSRQQEQFEEACNRVIEAQVLRTGIGTLSEKTLHAVLKHYFEPDITKQEVKIGTHYADIYNETGIIEVQTKQFNRLRKKLELFLKEYEVTIVYPIASEKILHWVNESTGEISKGRKSPKKGSPYMIFPELYKIKSFLTSKQLHFVITMLKMEEYRMLNGWSRDKKKGSTCNDRIPTDIKEEIAITKKSDFSYFIPFGLPDQFISKEFAKAANIPVSLAQVTLNVLTEVGSVVRVGKQGNSIVYQTLII